MKKVVKAIGIAIGVVLGVVGILVVTCVLRWPPDHSDYPYPDIQATDDPAVIERGAYLVNAVTHCPACHAPLQEYVASRPGDVVAPKGGHEWHMGPLGTLRGSNITPDEKTGIGSRTDAELARAIRHGVRADGNPRSS